MAYHDLLLVLFGHPEPTPLDAVDRAVRVARRLGGELTALGVKVRVEAPKNRLAEALIGLESMAAELRAESAETVREALARFHESARAVGLTAFEEVRTVQLYEEAEAVVAAARTRDMTLVPVGPSASATDQAIAERLLFDSGRPVVVIPEAGPVEAQTSPFARIAVAWDGSPPAARAVAEALPSLRCARDLRILTVLNEKPTARAGCAHDLVRHLGAHGLKPRVEEVEAAGREIAEVFAAYCAANRIELLVMGGFAHSRAREFILGGATAGVLARPFVPTLMSH